MVGYFGLEKHPPPPPPEQIETRSVQRLMSRRTCSYLPTADELFDPEVITRVPQKIEKRRRKAKFYYDRTAKELPELMIIYLGTTSKSLDRDRMRKAGTCAPCSYLVDSEGTIRRHRGKWLL